MFATSQPLTSARLIVHERLGLALLFALLIGVFIVLLPAPLLSLLGRSLSDRDGNFVGLANFHSYFASGALLRAFGHSLLVASLSTLLVLTSAFALATVAGFLFHYLGVAPHHQAIALILLLGLLAVGSTLWLMVALSEIRPEFHGLLGLFAINALCGALVVWLGSFVGNWLWQLNLSR
jgi:ABC-type spermidine/putrescine transport system permease subunit II